jgi:hypothetical protein
MVVQTVVNIQRERLPNPLPLSEVVVAAMEIHQPEVPPAIVEQAARLILDGTCTSSPSIPQRTGI